MVDLDAMDADPWPTWPVDKNELRGLVDEIERLRERRDDWRAAMTENHDLWNENERLRAALQKITDDNGYTECCGGGTTGDQFNPPECCGDPVWAFDRCVKIARAALEGEQKNG